MAFPGSIVLRYLHSGKERSVAVRLLNGQDPLNSATMTVEAGLFADALVSDLPTTAVVTGAYTKNTAGLRLIELDLGGDIPGTRAVVSGADDWYSTTFTITGRSTVVGPGGHVGHTLIRWHVGGIYRPLQGDSKLTVATIDVSGELTGYLSSSGRAFADYYGNKCAVEALGNYQFNAFIQKKDGT